MVLYLYIDNYISIYKYLIIIYYYKLLTPVSNYVD